MTMSFKVLNCFSSEKKQVLFCLLVFDKEISNWRKIDNVVLRNLDSRISRFERKTVYILRKILVCGSNLAYLEVKGTY